MGRSLTMLAAASLAFAGCAGATVNLSPGEQEELAPAMASPLSFELTAGDSNVAWGRAQIFVQNVPGGGVRAATDFILDGAWCRVSTVRAYYSAQRLPLDKDRARITVKVEPCAGKPLVFDSAEQVDRDAHVFAYFVRTGILACDRGGVSACVGGYEPPAPATPPPATSAPAPDTPTAEGGAPPACPGLPDPRGCEQGKSP
jgi:hypothetical protein